MRSDQDLYKELSYYTLSHKDPSLIHQHTLDAYIVQIGIGQTIPIAITFALAGLYLYFEKNFTGKQVQQMHMKMAKKKGEWPSFDLPKDKGNITVKDIIAIPAGSPKFSDILISCCCNW